MLHKCGPLALAVCVCLVWGSRAPAQEKPLDEVAQRGHDAVKSWLDQHNGNKAQLIVKDEPVLQKLFPEHVFVAARFRQFPVANQVPEGLRPSNLFAVTKKERTVRLLKTPQALEAFCKASQVPADDERLARNALAGWLTLVQEFQQDGFYKFQVLANDFAYEKNGPSQEVRGQALVTQGGKGELGAKLTFENGKLSKVVDTSKIMPGPRPICQATKLLDPDPIVRKMAEQDLLFMGLPAREYLMEQRARANSPELRDAIDRLWRKIQAGGW